MTPTGIEPATFPFEAQHLNHCAAVVPSVRWEWTQFIGHVYMNVFNFAIIIMYLLCEYSPFARERNLGPCEINVFCLQVCVFLFHV